MVGKEVLSLRLKIQGRSHSFDITQFEYDNKTALSSNNVENNELIAKIRFGINYGLHWFLITTYSIKQ